MPKVILEIEVDINREDLRDLANNIRDKIGGFTKLDFAEIDHFLNLEERKHIIREVTQDAPSSMGHGFDEGLTTIKLTAL